MAEPLSDDVGAFVPGPRVEIAGAAEGPLAGLGFAAKDLYDVAGHPTTYGHQRADVATYFKTPALEHVGFTVTLPAGAVKPGQHQAMVRVVAVDKSGYFDSVPIGFVAQ